MKAGTKIIIGLIIAIVLLFAFGISSAAKNDVFASCITEKGAKFYGAFWCPHCNDQKALFGSSVKNIAYIECSTPDGTAQTDICKQAGIESYPTWVFADNSVVNGVMSFEALSKKTGCVLP